MNQNSELGGSLVHRNVYELPGTQAPQRRRASTLHLVASHLNCWLLGTHPGAASGRYLDYYLNEFTFRFNW